MLLLFIYCIIMVWFQILCEREHNNTLLYIAEIIFVNRAELEDWRISWNAEHPWFTINCRYLTKLQRWIDLQNSMTWMSQHCMRGWEDWTITRSILNDPQKINRITKGYIYSFLSLPSDSTVELLHTIIKSS